MTVLATFAMYLPAGLLCVMRHPVPEPITDSVTCTDTVQAGDSTLYVHYYVRA